MSSPPEVLLFDRWNERAPSVGVVALAHFAIALLSGALLAPFWSATRPFDSLQLLLVSNPFGTLLRGLHYWSGQLFLVFTALHVVEHLMRSGEKRIQPGVWIRLCLSLPLALYLMVSGYVLKGDAEALLARRVLAGLLELLPGIGGSLRTLLAGASETDLTAAALQHAGLATVLLVTVIFEHYRGLWPSKSAWSFAMATCLLAALLLPPGLHSPTAPAPKGPWYLLGVQELLHWLPAPGWLWIPAGAWLAALGALLWLRPRAATLVRRGLALTFAFYLLLLPVGAWLRGDGWQWQLAAGPSPFTSPRVFLPDDRVTEHPTPRILGRREGCLVCHSELQGLSPAHRPEAVGCASCHGGEIWTANERLAHHGMELVPGNLARAEQACGAAGCHPAQVERVLGSPMATARGIVAVNRFVFGEADSPDGLDTIADLGTSPADEHLQELCSGCHLGEPKDEPAPIGELSRGGGCTACHLVDDAPRDQMHPRLTVAVSDEHCFGCHSRSGRISTSYQGWHESGRPEGRNTASLRGDPDFRILDDGRVFSRQPADVHHEAGLACIDCHTSRELMGDGRSYPHQHAAIEISCEDCHRSEPARFADWSETDPESQRILRLRLDREPTERRTLLAASSGLALVNLYEGPDGAAIFEGKLSGKRHPLNPPAPVCGSGISGHERLSCSSCHSAWVPTCLGCHTQRTPDGWRELGGSFLTGPPTLGLRDDPESSERIVPFAPGMILTLGLEEAALDPSQAPELQAHGLFRRLFAPVAPHTTAKKGLDCLSCHLDPVVLGYGSGHLQYRDREFHFEPTWGPLRDGLPADGWIPWLGEPTAPWSTRSDARPLPPERQRRILLVGACLGCHPDTESSRRQLYSRYEEALEELSSRCELPPDWPERRELQ